MDNKLSELSKPKAFVVTGGTLYQDRAFTDKSTAERSKADRHDGAVVEPLYSQEYVSALTQRIAELESIRADASQVFKEIGNELGCNPDNESIMMAIDDLKATQMTGPLKDVLKRNIELEAKLATPVRLPLLYSPDPWMGPDPSGTWLDKEDVKDSIRTAGFKVEGDA